MQNVSSTTSIYLCHSRKTPVFNKEKEIKNKLHKTQDTEFDSSDDLLDNFKPNDNFYINRDTPVFFENDFFKGYVLVLFRPENLSNYKYRDVFEGKKRIFEIQVQGKFKRSSEGIIYFGLELDEIQQLDLFTSGVRSAILAFIKNLPSCRLLDHSYGVEIDTKEKKSKTCITSTEKKENCTNKLKGPSFQSDTPELDINPHLVFPLTMSSDRFIKTNLCHLHQKELENLKFYTSSKQVNSSESNYKTLPCGCERPPTLGTKIHEDETSLNMRRNYWTALKIHTDQEWNLFRRKILHQEQLPNKLTFDPRISTDCIYTFTYGSMYLDLLNWEIINIPLLRHIHLSRFTPHNKLSLVAYEVACEQLNNSNEQNNLLLLPNRKPHSSSNKRYMIKLSFEHS